MPSRSAPEIEDDIRVRWLTRKLRARGLWLTIRDLIERHGAKRPGHLLAEDGSPMGLEEVAEHANASLNTATSLMRQLVVSGLLATASDGTYYSKPLAELHRVRRAAAKRQLRRRQGVTSRPNGRDVHPMSHPRGKPAPPPPMVSPPIPPSSLSPPAPHPVGREEGRPTPTAEDLKEARRFAVGWIKHNRPKYLDLGARPFTRLVALVGKQRAVEEVKVAALDKTVRNPFAAAWALHDPAKKRANDRPPGGDGGDTGGPAPPGRRRTEPTKTELKVAELKRLLAERRHAP